MGLYQLLEHKNLTVIRGQQHQAETAGVSASKFRAAYPPVVSSFLFTKWRACERCQPEGLGEWALVFIHKVGNGRGSFTLPKFLPFLISRNGNLVSVIHLISSLHQTVSLAMGFAFFLSAKLHFCLSLDLLNLFYITPEKVYSQYLPARWKSSSSMSFPCFPALRYVQYC